MNCIDVCVVNEYHTVQRALDPQLLASEGVWGRGSYRREAAEGQRIRTVGGLSSRESQVFGTETYIRWPQRASLRSAMPLPHLPLSRAAVLTPGPSSSAGASVCPAPRHVLSPVRRLGHQIAAPGGTAIRTRSSDWRAVHRFRVPGSRQLPFRAKSRQANNDADDTYYLRTPAPDPRTKEAGVHVSLHVACPSLVLPRLTHPSSAISPPNPFRSPAAPDPATTSFQDPTSRSSTSDRRPLSRFAR